MDDFVITPASETSCHLIASAGGFLRWNYTTNKTPIFLQALMWDTFPVDSLDAEGRLARFWNPNAAQNATDTQWKWEWCGLKIGTGYEHYLTADGGSAAADFRASVIPYWLVAVPLTLLSAYLLLWKPRKRV